MLIYRTMCNKYTKNKFRLPYTYGLASVLSCIRALHRCANQCPGIFKAWMLLLQLDERIHYEGQRCAALA